LFEQSWRCWIIAISRYGHKHLVLEEREIEDRGGEIRSRERERERGRGRERETDIGAEIYLQSTLEHRPGRVARYDGDDEPASVHGVRPVEARKNL
jgi:hypothetical protein